MKNSTTYVSACFNPIPLGVDIAERARKAVLALPQISRE